jgi:hypothetical protein
MLWLIKKKLILSHDIVADRFFLREVLLGAGVSFGNGLSAVVALGRRRGG